MHIRVVIGEYTRNESGEDVQYPGKEILVNSNCPIRILYDFIQKRLNINSCQEFDLSDENGNLVFIYEKEPWMNGRNYLAPKTTYFVVLFSRDEETRVLNPVVQMPELLKKSNNQWNEIMTKIKKQLNPSSNTKVSRASKTRLNSSNVLKEIYQ